MVLTPQPTDERSAALGSRERQERPRLPGEGTDAEPHAARSDGEGGVRTVSWRWRKGQRHDHSNCYFSLKSSANAFAFRSSPVANFVSAFQSSVLPGPNTFFFMNSPTSLSPT